MAKVSELKMLDVVNVNDGKRLGAIQDLDLDLEKGEVKAIIIPGAGGLLSRFTGSRDYIIPWSKVVKIGVDTILVDLPDEPYIDR